MSGRDVLYPMSNRGFGGAVIMASRLVRHLQVASPWEMRVCLHSRGPNAELFEDATLQPDSLGLAPVPSQARNRLLHWLRYYGAAARVRPYGRIVHYLRGARPALIHIHDAQDLVTWGWVARRLGIDVIWHVHTFHKRRIGRLPFRLCDHVVFVSEATRDHFARLTALPPHDVVHNGVEVARFDDQGGRASAKARLGLDSRRLTIGFVGQLTARKRPDWSVRAALDLLADGHDFQMVVVGADQTATGEHRAELERMIRDAGQTERVHLLGFRDDIPDVMRALDVLTFSSEADGEAFPLVVLEAMAAETAVVATRSAGVPEAITDGVTGLLADAHGYDDFVRQLTTAIRCPALRSTLAAAAREEARTRFSIDRCAADVSATYARVLDRSLSG